MQQMNISRGVQQAAKKVVIYGPEGIGKSTFASRFPNPVFIDAEGSTAFMDVARTPRPSSFMMLLEQIRYFIAHPNELRTLVIDTADWAERMCTDDLLKTYGKKSIEDFGYGKGYVMVYEQFGSMLNLCTTLVETCGVNVVITAHAWMRKFEQPDELGSYDRWELKLGQKTGSRTAPIIKEWSDLLLFANYKTYVINVDDQGAAKGKNKVQGGKRVMYTTHHPCWDAKNRFGLAEELPFEFAQIARLFDTVPIPAAQPKVTPAPIDDTPIIPSNANSSTAAPVTENTFIGENTIVNTDEIVDEEEGIPPALVDLMRANAVRVPEIQLAVALRGYYPNDTPIANYAPDFINGVLIGAWPQVFEMIKQNRADMPF